MPTARALLHPDTFAALVKEAIAFAIEHGDNCAIPDGYADRNGYPDVDWLSDWGAFMADHVFDELHVRGFKVVEALEQGARDSDAGAPK